MTNTRHSFSLGNLEPYPIPRKDMISQGMNEIHFKVSLL